MKIKTEFVNPPIPIRNFDYMAYDADTYEGRIDDDHCPIGWGKTEDEAIQNLKAQLEAEYWRDCEDVIPG